MTADKSGVLLLNATDGNHVDRATRDRESRALDHRELRTSTGAKLPTARQLAEALVGRAIPKLCLERYDGTPVDIGLLADLGIVVYLYPAAASSPDTPGDSRAQDAAQHRVFDEHAGDLRGCRLHVIGISSETRRVQLMRVLENRVCHQLLSDPELQLAGALGLPTFTAPDGGECYRRLTIVARAGRITKVFYPVGQAHRSADQVLAWLRATGQ